jgi:hypothetical protein
VIPACGSFGLRFDDGRPSVYFYWDDLPSRRLRPDLVDSETALEQAKPHWQIAAHELMMAAEHGGIFMLAEIAMRRALAHSRPTPAPTPRKKAAKKYRIVRRPCSCRRFGCAHWF